MSRYMELEDEEHEALFPALAMCLQFNEQVRGRGRGMGRGRGRGRGRLTVRVGVIGVELSSAV